MNTIKLPDVTLVQLLAALTWVVTQFVAWGWLDNNTGQVVVSIAGAALPMIWMVADAVIRHGRSKIAAAAVLNGNAAKVTQTRV